MTDCHNLTALPESLGQLAALKTLTISHRTRVPESICQLTALCVLKIGWLDPGWVAQLLQANRKLARLRQRQLVLVALGLRRHQRSRYRLPVELWYIVDTLLWQQQPARYSYCNYS